MPFDIVHPNLRDRRLAASDEAISTKNGPIYGLGTSARRAGDRDPDGFDLRRLGTSRTPEMVNTIVLHVTAGNEIMGGALPPSATDSDIASRHLVDRVNAHFVVLNDGTIVYARDVLHILNNAGGRRGIDIEFSGRYGLRPNPRRRRPRYVAAESPSDALDHLSWYALISSRLLVERLVHTLPIRFIHPHGQFTAAKRDTCPGPDIWLNVGEWACDHLGVTSHNPARPGEISAQQRNYAFYKH